jgi:hypothetical protein
MGLAKGSYRNVRSDEKVRSEDYFDSNASYSSAIPVAQSWVGKTVKELRKDPDLKGVCFYHPITPKTSNKYKVGDKVIVHDYSFRGSVGEVVKVPRKGRDCYLVTVPASNCDDPWHFFESELSNVSEEPKADLIVEPKKKSKISDDLRIEALGINLEETLAMMALLYHVSGSPETSSRKYIDSLRKKLESIEGLEEMMNHKYPMNEEYDREGISGFIDFHDKI